MKCLKPNNSKEFDENKADIWKMKLFTEGGHDINCKLSPKGVNKYWLGFPGWFIFWKKSTSTLLYDQIIGKDHL